MFMVNYVDDNGRKHITIAKDFNELRFIQERFDIVSYEVAIKG